MSKSLRSINALIFQSTPSVGRTTRRCIGDMIPMQRYFNPRPPWGGRRYACAEGATAEQFQSTPSVGRTTMANMVLFSLLIFQSTPSVGRTTTDTRTDTDTEYLFQSTPSVGRTTTGISLIKVNNCYFNPRPPWGGRH